MFVMLFQRLRFSRVFLKGNLDFIYVMRYYIYILQLCFHPVVLVGKLVQK